MGEGVNDKTPPPSLHRRKTAAERQHMLREQNAAKETAEEHARLAAEVAQLKSQLERRRTGKNSPSVEEPTPKRTAASKKKLVKK